MRDRHCVSLLGVVAAAAVLCGQQTGSAWRPEAVSGRGLPNAYWLHSQVISGGEPAGEQGFVTLQELGVRTIISVDGAQPPWELAGKHGLRYVHLPHGYDGVPDERIKELAKAVRELPGPIYIHCHHGQHRSPAAAAVACVAAGLIAPEQALTVLATAGTSEKYRGLYESARAARRMDGKLLDELRVEFPESVKVPPIAEAMVQIEHIYDHLMQFAAAKWGPLAERPDLDPAHEALLLKEHYRELGRTPDAAQQTTAFRELLSESERTAELLENQLRAWQAASRPDAQLARQALTLAEASQQCVSCHQKFRDVPLAEKKR